MNKNTKALQIKKASKISSIVAGLLTCILYMTLRDNLVAWVPMFLIFVISIAVFVFYPIEFEEPIEIKRKEREQNTTQSEDNKTESPDPDIIIKFDRAVRFNFPELPKDEFKLDEELYHLLEKECDSGKPSISTLQSILMKMEHHIGVSHNNQSIIFLSKIDFLKAGYIEERDYSLNEITISYNEIFGADNYISILAHELSHAFQFSKKLYNLFPAEDNMNEKFTDALTFYLGFGAFTQKGKHAIKKTVSIGVGGMTSTLTETSTLGYLNENYFDFLSNNSIELLNERKKNQEEKLENNLLKTKIESLLLAHKNFLDSCFELINMLKHKQNHDDEFETINLFYSKFNEFSHNVLKNKAINYKNQNISKNRETIIMIESELESLFYFITKFQHFNTSQ